MKTILFTLIAQIIVMSNVFSQTISWTKHNSPSDSVLTAIAIDTVNNLIYIGTAGEGLFKSTDDGLTWTPILGITKPVSAIFISSKGYVVIGTTNEIYTSKNNGGSWVKAEFNIFYAPKDFAEDKDNNLYAAFGHYMAPFPLGLGVLKSIDDGVTWVPHNNGFNNHTSVWEIATDGHGRLYAGVFGKGLYVSTDKGTSWEHIQIEIDGQGVVNNLIDGRESLALEISPDDSIYYSLTGASGTVGVEMVLKNSYEGAITGINWTIVRTHNLGWFWMYRASHSLLFMDSKHILGSTVGGATSAGPVASNNYGNYWVINSTGIDAINGNYNRMYMAKNADKRVYLIQEMDNQLYYTDAYKSPKVGIEEPLVTALKVYPNPASDILNFKVEDEWMSGYLTIFDMAGRVYAKENINNSSSKINISELPAGIYIIQLRTEKGNFNTKFTKN